MKKKIFYNMELDFLQYSREVIKPMYIFRRAE